VPATTGVGGGTWLAADPTLAPCQEPADLDIVQTGAVGHRKLGSDGHSQPFQSTKLKDVSDVSQLMLDLSKSSAPTLSERLVENALERSWRDFRIVFAKIRPSGTQQPVDPTAAARAPAKPRDPREEK
jgi:hypothetical protein